MRSSILIVLESGACADATMIAQRLEGSRFGVDLAARPDFVAMLSPNRLPH